MRRINEYIFKQLNEFGNEYGGYVVICDEVENGLCVTAKAKNVKKSRVIIIHNRKVV